MTTAATPAVPGSAGPGAAPPVSPGITVPAGITVSPGNTASPGTTAGRQPAAGSGAAALLVLGSCTSLQAGAALAIRLFPVGGTPGATLLRLALAAAVLLGVTRPRARAWRPVQWRAVGLYGISMAGTR